MEILEFLRNKQDLQKALLDFIEGEVEYEDLEDILNEQNLSNNKSELKSFFYLLLSISNNHHRIPNFISKIEQIILFYKTDLIEQFTNYQLFDLFKNNKRILLILFQQQMVSPDSLIKQELNGPKYVLRGYPIYFSPELNSTTPSIDLFDAKRETGENDHQICQMIREDSVAEFVEYVTKNSISLNSNIDPSPFETNEFLLNSNEITLIEYAAFFGSLQVMKYLYLSKVNLTPSIWKFAIHGEDPEMIHFLEENIGHQSNTFYKACLCESIKCHHMPIVEYIKEVLISDKDDDDNDDDSDDDNDDDFYQNQRNFLIDVDKDNSDQLVASIKYFNYITIPEDIINNEVFYLLCEFDHFTLVQLYIETKSIKIDLNEDANNPLEIASKKRNIEIIELLLKYTDRIKKKLFQNCLDLVEINISSSIKFIEDYSFEKCIFLKNVVIPSSVTKIGSFAFKDCSSLIEISDLSSVTSIGLSSFINCSSLMNLSISSVKAIEDSAFKGCSSLSSINLSPSLKKIGKDAFNFCTSLKEIVLPNSLDLIDENIFHGCSSLEKVLISSSLTVLKASMFSDCNSLKEIVIPPSVIFIRKYAFANCKSLERIVIPSSVNFIGFYAFAGCSSLKSIIIPPNVTSIQCSAFCECSSLESIKLPSSLSLIDKSAFYKCASLKEITIPSSVKKINDSAFEQCTSLAKIEIPSSVESIGKSLFAYCSSLEDISILCELKSISDKTFYDCRSLKNLKIPPSVSSLGNYAFCKCTSIAHIVIPPSVVSIGENAFDGCSSLSEIIIPLSVEMIGIDCFCNCNSLKKVVLPSSLKGTELGINNDAEIIIE